MQTELFTQFASTTNIIPVYILVSAREEQALYHYYVLLCVFCSLALVPTPEKHICCSMPLIDMMAALHVQHKNRTSCRIG